MLLSILQQETKPLTGTRRRSMSVNWFSYFFLDMTLILDTWRRSISSAPTNTRKSRS